MLSEKSEGQRSVYLVVSRVVNFPLLNFKSVFKGSIEKSAKFRINSIQTSLPEYF